MINQHKAVIMIFLLSVFLSMLLTTPVFGESPGQGKVIKSFISEDASYNALAMSMGDIVTVKNKKDVFLLDDKKITWSGAMRGGLMAHNTPDYTVIWYAPDGLLFVKQEPKPLFGDCAGLKSSILIDKGKMKDKIGLWKTEVTYKNVLIDNKYFYLLEKDTKEIQKADIDSLEALIEKNRPQIKPPEITEPQKANEIEEPKIANVNGAVEGAKITEESKIEEPKIKEKPQIEQKNELPQKTQETAIVYKNVMILEPLLVYENAYTEQRFGAVDNSTWLIVSTDLPAKAAEVLSKSGLASMTINSLSDTQKIAIKAAFNNLHDNIEELIKQWKDKGRFLQDFTLIKDACKCDAILVQFVKAKMGVGGTWDFINTGAITAPTSTTIIKAVLIDLNSGKITWSDSAIERNIPEKYVIKNCLDKLYSNFPGYKK